MTAILEEIRRLEAARKRGDLSPDAFENAKNALLADVEDVPIVSQTSRFARRPREHNNAGVAGRSASPASPQTDETSGIWGLLSIGFLGAGILTFLLAQLIGDMTIAVTLVVTIFAAVLVKAAKRLES